MLFFYGYLNSLWYFLYKRYSESKIEDVLCNRYEFLLLFFSYNLYSYDFNWLF